MGTPTLGGTTAPKGRRGLLWAVLPAAALFAVALLLFLLWPGPDRPAPGAEYAKLVGRWVRPGEDYVLEVRGVAPDGTMEVGYFNPNPIKVARAEASRDGDAVRVVVELRDVNYPGSTYTLHYDPKHDMLAGEYLQGMTKEQFDVLFQRE